MKILLFFLFFLSLASYGQNKENIYYINKKGRIVKQLDSAAYIRVIQEPDSGSANYNLYEYYLDHKKRRQGYVSQFEPQLVFQGQLISYYKNGKESDIVNYVNGRLTGSSFEYYENGQLKKAGKYEEDNNAKNLPPFKYPFPPYKLVDYFDSTGVQQIKNGDGYFKKYNTEKYGDEGRYKNGMKDGEWKGVSANGWYTENYSNGVFAGGVARWTDGSEHHYTTLEALPEYKGGMREFYIYFGKNYKYPDQARRAGIKGRVMVEFVVQKDGSLTDLVLLKDLGSGTGEEALRVLRESPDWQPGTQHGIPVKVAFTLPIMLNLAR